MPDIQITDYAVSAWQENGEWHSHNISFEDYSRMNTQQRKQSGERRLPTPTWAVNDAEFREVLVNFLEERCYTKPWKRTGSLQERLKRAQESIIAYSAKIQAALDSRCADYVLRKRTATTPEDFAWLRKQEAQIENLDTRLRFESKDGGAAMVTAVRYFYYRVGLDSVGVGTELGIKPPHVRQILWRLHQTAKILERWQEDPTSRPTADNPLPRRQRLKERPGLVAGKSIYSRKETILKHVAGLESIAKNGKLPSRLWLVQNGFDQSQMYMREFPSYFAHLTVKRQPHHSIDREEAQRLRAEGYSFSQIAHKLGCSRQGVQGALLDEGLHAPKPPAQKKPKEPKPPVLCAECGKECPPTHYHPRKFCSPRCRRKGADSRYREKQRAARRRFCSTECRQAAKKHKPAAAVNFTYQFSA